MEVVETSWPQGMEAVGSGVGRSARSGIRLGERGSERWEGRRDYFAAIAVVGVVCGC